jgi:hypothetical protein
MDFQTHQSIEKWTENISFRHINIPCPVTYRSFSHLKLTVKWVWHRRPPRARARQTWRAERGGSRPPTSPGLRASAAAYLQDQVKGGPPTSLRRTMSVNFRGPDYEVTKKVEPIRNGCNPIFDSYTIPRHELWSIFRILTTFW